MIRRWRRLRRRESPAELHITAFMNLMVVLVPFLLITAVFSRMAVLQLNLPSPSSQASPTDERFEIFITVRTDRLDVVDSKGKALQTFARGATGTDYAGLNQLALRLKQQHPDSSAATVLLEPDTDYDTVVQVMDAIRATQSDPPEPLFTEIAVGDAEAGD